MAPPDRSEQAITFRNAAVLFTFLLQLSALIWGAAKIDSAVKNLETTVTRLVSDYETVEDLNVRVTVLERELARRPAGR